MCLFVLLLLVCLPLASLANPPAESEPLPVYYSWLTEDVTSFTNDRKLIPSAVRDKLTVIPGGQGGEIYSHRVTLMSKVAALQKSRARNAYPTALAARLKHLRAAAGNRPGPSPALRECGEVTVTAERRQVGAYNRRMYIAKDVCGVLSTTAYPPVVDVQR